MKNKKEENSLPTTYIYVSFQFPILEEQAPKEKEYFGSRCFVKIYSFEKNIRTMQMFAQKSDKN